MIHYQIYKKFSNFEKYNPYYNTKDKVDIERYKNNRDTTIFNNTRFNNPSKSFMESSIKFNIVKKFEDNITEFINKIIFKIKDISTFVSNGIN